MSLPWFKGRTNGTIAGMLQHAWTLDHPCPTYVAELELQAVTANGQRDDWSVRALAARWCWSVGSTYRWLKTVEQCLAASWNNTHLEKQGVTAQPGTLLEQKRTPLVRDPLREKEKEKEKTTTSLSGKPDGKVSPAQEVYDYWRSFHPRSSKCMTGDRRTMLNARIRDSGVESCRLVTRWIHESPGAAFYRGENDQGKTYTGIGTLFKAAKWGDRVDLAQEWEAEGFSTEATVPLAPKERAKQEQADEFAQYMAQSGMDAEGNPLEQGTPLYDLYVQGKLDPPDDCQGERSNVFPLNLGENR